MNNEEQEKPFEERLEAAISAAIPYSDYCRYDKFLRSGGINGHIESQRILAKHEGAILEFPAEDDSFKEYYFMAAKRLGLPLSDFQRQSAHEKGHRDSLLSQGISGNQIFF